MSSTFDRLMTEWRSKKKQDIIDSGMSIHEHDVYCPYCGHIDRDYYECNPKLEEWVSNECGKCEKFFEFKMEYVFSSRKPEAR